MGIIEEALDIIFPVEKCARSFCPFRKKQIEFSRNAIKINIGAQNKNKNAETDIKEED